MNPKSVLRGQERGSFEGPGSNCRSDVSLNSSLFVLQKFAKNHVLLMTSIRRCLHRCHPAPADTTVYQSQCTARVCRAPPTLGQVRSHVVSNIVTVAFCNRQTRLFGPQNRRSIHSIRNDLDPRQPAAITRFY